MNFEMWIMYVSWNLPTSPVLSFARFSSNVKIISAAETGISTASTPRSCRTFCHVLGLKIALILLRRHFWTLNFSSLKQRKGNNIYKLTQTWNSGECSWYSIWQRTNVRTLRVCLQSPVKLHVKSDAQKVSEGEINQWPTHRLSVYVWRQLKNWRSGNFISEVAQTTFVD